MALSVEDKANIATAHGVHATDTGSTQVQVALITSRLAYLQGHFKSNPKDVHSRRGLLKLVGQRRRLLNYLKRTDITAYRELVAKLGLRK